MAFTVHYFKSSGTVTEERWIGKPVLAQIVARQAVLNNIAVRVEIRNEGGELVFHFPPVMQNELQETLPG